MTALITRLLVTTAIALAATDASAQQQGARPRAERPYRGLFGGGVGDAQQLLDITLLVGAGVVEGVPVDALDPLLPPQGAEPSVDADTSIAGSAVSFGSSERRTYGNVMTRLSYALTRPRVSVGATAATEGRYFRTATPEYVGDYNGALGVSLQMSERLEVRVNQGVAVHPYTALALPAPLMDPLLGGMSLAGQDVATRREDYVSYMGGGDLAYMLSPRSSLSFSHSYHASDFTTEASDLFSRATSGRLRVGVSRGLGLRLGYGLNEGRYATATGPTVVRAHTLDAGVDFNRAISFSRRTRVAFATGTAALADGGRTTFHLVGNASVTQEIGRTWDLSVAFNRGFQFVERFREPFFSDSMTAGVSGLVTRRLQARSGISGTFGNTDVTGGGGDFRYHTYQTASALVLALSRHVGFQIEHVYYLHRFAAATPLAPGLARDLDRHGLRANVILWAPLVYRARRPDASR
jgi:hypothetical protein